MPNQLLRDKLSLSSASEQVLDIADCLERHGHLKYVRICIEQAAEFWESRLGDKYPSIRTFKECKARGKSELLTKLHSLARELSEDSYLIEVSGEYAVRIIAWVNSGNLMHKLGDNGNSEVKTDLISWVVSPTTNKELLDLIECKAVFPCQWEIIETPEGLTDSEVIDIIDAEGWIPEEPTDLDLAYIQENSEEYEDDLYPDCNKKMASLLIDCFANLLKVVNVQIYDIDTIKRLSDHHYKGFMINALPDFEAGDIIHHHMYISWLSIPETLDTRESIIEYINDCLYTVNKFTTN